MTLKAWVYDLCIINPKFNTMHRRTIIIVVEISLFTYQKTKWPVYWMQIIFKLVCKWIENPTRIIPYVFRCSLNTIVFSKFALRAVFNSALRWIVLRKTGFEDNVV